jgi:ribonuclease D
VPPFKVFGNEQIFELLLWAVAHPGVPLHEGPKLPRNIVGARLSTLEEAILRAVGMSPAQWPEPIKIKHERDPALSNQCKEQIEALRAECARIAKELNIAASTLAPRAALEAIARSRSRTVDEIMRNGCLLRWQAELMQGAVDRILRPH